MSVRILDMVVMSAAGLRCSRLLLGGTMGFPSIADLASYERHYVVRFLPVGLAGGVSGNWIYMFFDMTCSSEPIPFDIPAKVSDLLGVANVRVEVWLTNPLERVK